MSVLAGAANDYVTVRRRMGFKFQEGGELVHDFVRHLDDQDFVRITTAAAVTWARSSGHRPSWWAKRLSVARGFANYMAGLEPGHEVPPPGLLPRESHRATPYLYSQEDVGRLMLAARSITNSWSALTVETAIGLLAVTGVRVGELVRLDLADVDWDRALLTVRRSKFDKSRLIPLHPSTVAALRNYEVRRKERDLSPETTALFVSTAGRRLRYDILHRIFRRLVKQLRLETATAGRHPRIHDLRHAFAVSTLLDWYRAGADVAALTGPALHLPGPHRPRGNLLVLLRRT